MTVRRMLDADWKALKPAKQEEALARRIVRRLCDVDEDEASEVSRDGMYCFELFDTICLLRGEGLRRKRAQERREEGKP